MHLSMNAFATRHESNYELPSALACDYLTLLQLYPDTITLCPC